MKRRIAIISLTAVILIPFLINLFGWNLYFYLNIGQKDLILASANGVSHNAWAEHVELDDHQDYDYLPMLEDHSRTILNAGPFDLFLERRDGSMSPFTFRWIESDEYMDYSGFEFPWLLLLGIPIAILVSLKLLRRQKPKEEG